MAEFKKTGLFDAANSEGDGDWNEEDHPRDDEGKFADKWSQNTASSNKFQKNKKKSLTKANKYVIMRTVKDTLESANVRYNAVKPLTTKLSEKEIIARVGTKDMTRGSCSSLAYAYIANKNQLDVLDNRGGISGDIFADPSINCKIAQLPGVNGIVLHEFNDYTAAHKLLNTLKPGKEYYLGVGYHVAIVRKTSVGYEYLELQDHKHNGFKPLTNKVLKDRFYCENTYVNGKYRITVRSCLIESESLCKSNEFKDLLGYINTSQQQKGVKGHVK